MENPEKSILFPVPSKLIRSAKIYWKISFEFKKIHISKKNKCTSTSMSNSRTPKAKRKIIKFLKKSCKVKIKSTNSVCWALNSVGEFRCRPMAICEWKCLTRRRPPSLQFVVQSPWILYKVWTPNWTTIHKSNKNNKNQPNNSEQNALMAMRRTRVGRAKNSLHEKRIWAEVMEKMAILWRFDDVNSGW